MKAKFARDSLVASDTSQTSTCTSWLLSISCFISPWTGIQCQAYGTPIIINQRMGRFTIATLLVASIALLGPTHAEVVNDGNNNAQSFLRTPRAPKASYADVDSLSFEGKQISFDDLAATTFDLPTSIEYSSTNFDYAYVDSGQGGRRYQLTNSTRRRRRLSDEKPKNRGAGDGLRAFMKAIALYEKQKEVTGLLCLSNPASSKTSQNLLRVSSTL